MPDEKQEKKRPKQPPIGSIQQYATIGGGRKNFEESTPSTLEPPDAQTLTPQTSGDSVTQTSNVQNLNASNAESLAVQKFDDSSHQVVNPSVSRKSKVQTSKRLQINRQQQTAWIPTDLARWLRLQAAMEEREISEIVTEALEEYRRTH